MNTPIKTSLERLFFRFTLILVGITSIALLPEAQAVNPAPDGGYPGGNTAEGQNALFSLTTGGYNTALGFFSLRSDTTGSFNTAIGAGALLANTADQITATGVAALLSNTTGCCNTANGAFALSHNTTGSSNQAFGLDALQYNDTGTWNDAFGGAALRSNTTGDQNCAFGEGALISNTTGGQNVAVGYLALQANNGYYNTAVGRGALLQNTTGESNVAVGIAALQSNTTGLNNVALGHLAGNGVSTANNVICIGASVYGGNVSNSCYIGNISGQPIDPASAAAVYVDNNNKLGTPTSSRRFKHDIKPMDKDSKAILLLAPVSFHYNSDPKNTPCFGLIAEDVEKVNPALVLHDKEGKPCTVRYETVNAMLLNEFLKEHRKVEAQQATIAELKSTVARQQSDFKATAAEQRKQIQDLAAQIKEQATQIQKVSVELQMSRPVPQVVVNKP